MDIYGTNFPKILFFYETEIVLLTKEKDCAVGV